MPAVVNVDGVDPYPEVYPTLIYDFVPPLPSKNAAIRADGNRSFVQSFVLRQTSSSTQSLSPITITTIAADVTPEAEEETSYAVQTHQKNGLRSKKYPHMTITRSQGSQVSQVARVRFDVHDSTSTIAISYEDRAVEAQTLTCNEHISEYSKRWTFLPTAKDMEEEADTQYTWAPLGPSRKVLELLAIPASATTDKSGREKRPKRLAIFVYGDDALRTSKDIISASAAVAMAGRRKSSTMSLPPTMAAVGELHILVDLPGEQGTLVGDSASEVLVTALAVVEAARRDSTGGLRRESR